MEKPQNISPTKWQMVSLASELGFIIALPIAVLGLLGKYLDGRFGTNPWFKITGLLLAIVSTSIWLTRRFQQLLKNLKRDNKDNTKGQ